MTLILIGLAIFAAGCFGGIVNALMVDKGLKMPRIEKTKDGETIVRPGWIGNMVIGGFAALILWGLYGAGAQFTIIFGEEGTRVGNPVSLALCAYDPGTLHLREITVEGEEVRGDGMEFQAGGRGVAEGVPGAKPRLA